MSTKSDGERLASMETEVKNQGEKLNSIENSVQGLHGKFDNFSTTFTKNLAENYVPIRAFDEYKGAQKEKDKNKFLERLLLILVTAAISGLVGFFINTFK